MPLTVKGSFDLECFQIDCMKGFEAPVLIVDQTILIVDVQRRSHHIEKFTLLRDGQRIRIQFEKMVVVELSLARAGGEVYFPGRFGLKHVPDRTPNPHNLLFQQIEYIFPLTCIVIVGDDRLLCVISDIDAFFLDIFDNVHGFPCLQDPLHLVGTFLNDLQIFHGQFKVYLLIPGRDKDISRAVVKGDSPDIPADEAVHAPVLHFPPDDGGVGFIFFIGASEHDELRIFFFAEIDAPGLFGHLVGADPISYRNVLNTRLSEHLPSMQSADPSENIQVEHEGQAKHRRNDKCSKDPKHAALNGHVIIQTEPENYRD